jgi:drug/metabolite transporter (DMT)-like permease
MSGDHRSKRDMSYGLATHRALALLAVVVVAWGTNWPVTKMIVREVSPLWSTTLRCAIAAAILALLLWARGHFVIPKRGDVPVVLSTSLLHMVAYSALIAAGLQFVPASTAIVLGYTTPLWVAIGARVFLSEDITRWRAIGIGSGLAGLAVIFNPRALDWSDRGALIGSGLILAGSLCWAANIVYVRAHRWISSPFQLVFWQVLLAAGVLAVAALVTDGVPRIDWNTRLVALLLLSGIVSTALAHWAMSMVNRSLPAVTTSLGLLATPALGIVSAGVILNEPLEPSLLLAFALIIGGIALGTVSGSRVTWLPRVRSANGRHEWRVPTKPVQDVATVRRVDENVEALARTTADYASGAGELRLGNAAGREAGRSKVERRG